MKRDDLRTMPEDLDDGAAYVRPGMRPPTDAEMDAEFTAHIAEHGDPADDLMAALEASEAIEGPGPTPFEHDCLPKRQPEMVDMSLRDDVRVNEKMVRTRASQSRRSRTADARLIERKRSAEDAALAARDDHPREPLEGFTRELPTDKDKDKDKDTYLPTQSSHEASLPSGAISVEDRESRELSVRRPITARETWWQISIRRSQFTAEDGVRHDLPSIRRHTAPLWRDLCEEARLDFYQDAGLALAAALDGHGLLHVTINLDRDIEKDALTKPNALEWCKYRIARSFTSCGFPHLFVIVAEEAPVKDICEQDKREALGLDRNARFHLHMLAVLPVARRAVQRLRDAFREPAVVGRWDEGATSRQIKIRSGDLRVLTDYLAKDLLQNSNMLQRLNGGCMSKRRYAGAPITVSAELRKEAINIYDRWTRTVKTRPDRKKLIL